MTDKFYSRRVKKIHCLELSSGEEWVEEVRERRYKGCEEEASWEVYV